MQAVPEIPMHLFRVPIPLAYPLPRPTTQVHHLPQGLAAQGNTMAGLVATLLDPALVSLLAIFTLLEA